jgi:hypothetical protein
MIVSSSDICDLERALANVDGDALVVFDCDDVLITIPEQIAGERGKKFFHEWCGKNIANLSEQLLYDLMTFILMSNRSYLVNEKMPKIVQGIQERGVGCIVLTALATKPIEPVDDPMAWRVATLATLGYDFGKSWPKLGRKIFDQYGVDHAPCYDSGVLCCGSTEKGKCLVSFIDYAEIAPSKVVFIDDLVKNLESVEAECGSANIEFLGMQYLESNKLAAGIEYSEEIMEYQLSTLKEKRIWVPYGEVARLLFPATPMEILSPLDGIRLPSSTKSQDATIFPKKTLPKDGPLLRE